jgi:hypothetical protein
VTEVFDQGNWDSDGTKPCPICGTKKAGPVILVIIEGTQEGYNAEAVQTHVDCLELTWDPKYNMIYQKVP